MGGGGGGGAGGVVGVAPDFKWQGYGWSKDFLGIASFDFGIFLGRKILANIFFGSLI